MSKVRILSVLVAAAVALGLFASVASAQGVTVITGSVTIDGVAAAAGTTVQVSEGGTSIGSTTTGAGSLAANQYRVDVQATAALEGQAILVEALTGGSVAGSASGTFNANRVVTINITGQAPAAVAAEPGPTGETGATGPAGPSGFKGARGVQGSDGVAGAAGAEGATGNTGATGPRGAQGSTGADGAAGSAGASGPSGAAGSAGASGPAGVAGATGDNGSSGLGVIALVLGIIAIVVAGGSVMMARRS